MVIGFHKYSKLEGLSSKPTTRDSFPEADDITTWLCSFELISHTLAYSLSQNTIESTKISREMYQPNSPKIANENVPIPNSD